jgi:16S rRNA (cytosine967-C5)-methyltransferase
MPPDRLSTEDRALAREITLGVLRWQLLLDYFIQRFSQRMIDQLDPPVLIALRMGIYQIRFLTRIPHSAAVSDAVDLVKRSRSKSAAGFVNAVLRKAASNTGEEPGAGFSGIERAAIESSSPIWLLERWTRQFGPDSAHTLALANNRPAKMAFRINTLKADRTSVVTALEAAGVRMRQSSVAPGGLVAEDGPPAALLEAADAGSIYLQDEASQLAGLLLAPRPGQLILDMCAAPGSKTTHIAALTGDSAEIIACDLRSQRLSTLTKISARLGVTTVRAIACDATHELPLSEDLLFDRILVDAPCSGTGTLRQNPEIKWRLAAADITRLSALQLSLLERAEQRLKPGGRLVYSVCSVEREEGEDVIAEFLRGHRSVELVTPDAPSELVTSDGIVRTFPDRDGTDGFFIAVLEKEVASG